MSQAAPVSDAPSGNWIDRYAPAPVKPYARLARFDRPIGAQLLLWPCWWSTALAAIAAGQSGPETMHLGLFAIGAFAMRGAGCTYNDIADRNFDGRVERTRSRPIPSGQVSLRAAWGFLAFLALIGLLVLLQFNPFTILLGMASLAVVAFYPFAKRVTHWPQVVLGLAFSWGALLGWSATFGQLDLAPLLLYGAGILWTIGYDTIYAHQDKEDDILIGVRSSALALGERTRPWLAVFYAGAIVLLALAGILAGAGAGFLIVLGIGAIHLGWQVVRLDTADPARCLTLFRSNRDFGAIIFAGLVLDAMIRSL